MKLLEDAYKKNEILQNERDAIVQAVYNHLQYSMPIERSLKTILLKHCKERNLQIPSQLEQ